ncbi:MAG TPA: helix-turn-helix domain-containing protein [Dongiaceae bacterium]|nr:helix-turn-helix domain-containing protein [Dongiaceae bacterium]
MTNGQSSRDIFSLIAQALADPRRYEILKQIARQCAPLSFSALRKEHDIGAPTMSYHLKLLAEANLIEVKRQGTRITVALRPEIVERYLRDVEHQLRLG